MIQGKLVFDLRLAIAKRGLGLGEKVQKVIDSEVIRRVDPYTPKRPGAKGGTLIKSAALHSKIGEGKVRNVTPYARRLYYNPQYNFTDAPRRGAYWFERMKADQKADILRTAAKAAGVEVGE